MNHQLRSLGQLASESGIDAGWILDQAQSGKLPAMLLPVGKGNQEWYFHRDAAANAIAEMIKSNFPKDSRNALDATKVTLSGLGGSENA